MQRVKQRGERGLVALLVVAGLLLSACAQAASEGAETSHDEPAKVEAVKGSDLSRITLTKRAIERIGLETSTVGTNGPGRVVPYGAVVYDPSGATWVYTSPESRVFVRAGITVDHIDGSTAVLSDGPAAGTVVVSVGAAELYGAELGIDH